MSAVIYLEGGASGPDSKELQTRCREGFRKLLAKCGHEKRMPRLVASGSRDGAFHDFRIGHAGKAADDFVAMWIDSEDPVQDLAAAWKHLKQRDNWSRPEGASDEQVLFMTTCMETLICADRAAVEAHYSGELQVSALPSLYNLESLDRHDVQDRLAWATRNCSNAYAKGKRSFEALAKLAPDTLARHLPSFSRARSILGGKLRG